MSEDTYENAKVTEINRTDSRDNENSYEDVYANPDNLNTQRPRSFMQAEISGGDTRWSRCYRLPAVCVVLLCVLLLIAVTLLWIKYNQLQTSYNTLTLERNQTQTSYNILTVERDQLQTSYNILTVERDQLQTSYNILTVERDQLQRERTFCNLGNNSLETLRELFFERNSKVGRHCFVCFSSNLYFMSNEEKTWTESRQACKDKKADLVIINSKEEQDFIRNMLTRRIAWIGLNDRDTEGVWKWVDDTPLSTKFWGRGEPNGATYENCVVNAPSFNWADYPCDREFMGICEKTIFN
ncbi:C-type lectin domain family 4 member M-like [Clarias gariepinus]|uniref:C-type lectin domain family 4 member M-like n=1 Tax=Clarias gariepinus TaxID=13013 RepID=UPI00234DD6B9|nr:C-type lectin domain family 4 member M-like [Clarias gariepinus]